MSTRSHLAAAAAGCVGAWALFRQASIWLDRDLADVFGWRDVEGHNLVADAPRSAP